MPDSLKGTIERIVFSNEEKQFLVAEFSPENEKRKVTVTGVLPGVQCGESLVLSGEWVSHPRHGHQFRIESFESSLPSSVHGIRKYLGSGLIPGIGKTYAAKIVGHFGVETLEVISNKSSRLREVPGIGRERARKIKQGWEEHRAFREVMIFLQTYGVSASKCLRLVKRYGESTEKKLRSDPYTLADEIDGIGFRTADQIAVNLGLPSDGPARVAAGLSFCLQQAADEGHTAMARGDLLSQAAGILGLPREVVEPVLDRSVEEKTILPVEGGMLLQRPDLARSESRIAEALIRLVCAQSALPPIDLEKAVKWAEKRGGIEFAEEQGKALEVALSNPVAVLTGGPGTGKTTILSALTAILSAKKVQIALASPTGRAAQRMSESTGLEAKTIHRLLEFEPGGGFVHNQKKPLPHDFIVVDETSMLDVRLAAALISAVKPGAHLLLVGDADQLPSVGAGDVLRNLIDCRRFPVVRLQRVFRQQGGSRIVELAYQVLGGKTSFPFPVVQTPTRPFEGGDAQFLDAADPETCLDRILRLVEYIPKTMRGIHPVRDIQVIVPLHKGVIGVANLNQALKEKLNPHASPGLFAVGDKVIQMRNNYDLGVFNGDTGIVKDCDAGDGSLRVDFAGNLVKFERNQTSDLSMAYAITVHKSQGSEYPVLILPLLKQHFLLLRRNLVYTAITRGKKAVFLVGDPDAYAMAVRQTGDSKRVTDLPRKIECGMG